LSLPHPRRQDIVWLLPRNNTLEVNLEITKGFPIAGVRARAIRRSPPAEHLWDSMRPKGPSQHRAICTLTAFPIALRGSSSLMRQVRQARFPSTRCAGSTSHLQSSLKDSRKVPTLLTLGPNEKARSGLPGRSNSSGGIGGSFSRCTRTAAQARPCAGRRCTHLKTPIHHLPDLLPVKRSFFQEARHPVQWDDLD